MALKRTPNVSGEGDTPHSKLDLFSGKHTTSLIVGILMFIIFAGLVTVLCIKEPAPENFVTGIVGLLGVLAGFFVSSAKKN